MIPICFGCVHFLEGSDPLKCDAFLDGIPDSILLGEKDHHRPVAGDKGIQFESASPIIAPSALGRLPYLKFD